MAELTQEDRDNYEKLKVAFKKLNDKCQTQNPPIKEVTKSINDNLPEPDKLSNDTGELRKIVDLVDSYLKIQALLLPGKSADIQDILNLNSQLNRSLKVVEGENLDLTNEVENVFSDSLFLDFLRKLTYPQNLRNWTEALLSDRNPNLNEQEINQLIQAWGQAVQKFVEDARKKDDPPGQVIPGNPETFAHFFGIHNELETLYSRLADTDALQRTS